MTAVAEIEFNEIVLPVDANHYGTLYGPKGLALLGRAAFLGATRFCGQSLVMVAADSIEFLAPAPVGSMLRAHARVISVGRRSLRVEVEVSIEDVVRPVLRGCFSLVAVNEQGQPTALSVAQKYAASPV